MLNSLRALALSLVALFPSATLVTTTLCLPAVALQGCAASTPIETYNTLNESFIFAVETSQDLRQLGIVSEEEYQDEYLPLINRGNELLRDMFAALSADPDQSNFDLLRTSLRSVLAELTQRAIAARTGDNDQ